MDHRRGAVAAPSLAAGLLLAASLPPWGWWPLAVLGFALAAWRLEGLDLRGRRAAGAGLGAGLFVPGLWWMGEFNAIGAVLVMALETAFVALAVTATPSGRGRWLALPGALVLAEAARSRVPFGGLPLAGVPLGQVAGPLAPSARLGGALLLLGLTVVAGEALAGLRRRPLAAAGALVGVAAVAAIGAAAPDGGTGPARRVAVVQGGGVRGLRAVDSDKTEVFRAHLDASRRVRPPVDLVLWPEDVIDVDRLVGSPESAAVGAMARGAGTTVVAGAVEDAGPAHFANAALAWGPDGFVADRYDKVHRVPFGEYVPGRSLIRHLVNLDNVARDARAGRGPGILRTTAGPMAVTISYEVYFADRARAAVHAGGRLLLVPTNASSFRTSQVPTTEVAAARLRAIETGRDTVQAAPTGYGAVIDNRGRVRARTGLGRREVLQRTVRLRSGRTPYSRTGDGPVVLIAALAVAAGWRRKTAGALDRAVN